MADKKYDKAFLERLGVDENMSDCTPMIHQFLEIKSEYPDVILLFRIGDFYEMFFNDAKKASQILQLFLTKKGAGNGVKIPMCGIPHHAYQSYAQKLLDSGNKVAIVEQLEDPRTTKKLVKRGVIQVITPGANLDLKNADNNFIASLTDKAGAVSLAYADLSTGELFVTNLKESNRDVLSKLMSLDVKELVVSTSYDANFVQMVKENTGICVSYCNDDAATLNMEPLFENVKDPRQMDSLARLLNYLSQTQKRELTYFEAAKVTSSDSFMKLDYSTLVNLELLKSMDGKHTYGTLYWLLNHCSTPMGSRFLKSAIAQPLAEKEKIEERLDSVEWLIENYICRQDLADALTGVYDLDRLIARISYGSTNGHDMLQLKKSLQAVPKVRKLLEESDDRLLSGIRDRMEDFQPLIDLLERSVREDAPLTITEGGIFKPGYDADLDKLLSMTVDSKTWIANLEKQEKERTGIKNLRVGYTKAFGYYIEVSKGNVAEVKPEFGYIRKQTLTTGERYTTADLQERESAILHGDDLRKDAEYKLFQDLRQKVAGYTSRIQSLSSSMALLDFLVSVAGVSSENGYCRPVFVSDRSIEVKDARHPVIEKAQPEKEFVSNDYFMGPQTDILIVTGPNMGGKSTYMREFALLTIMAQMGMFVPAKSCRMPVFDAIFTRIGASDDLIKGQSTFMVEMQETNKALANATSQSLVLFDEIGRGTATYDGMALAQAILEYSISRVHAKTFFSTHYHELTRLADKYPQMANVHVSVKEEEGKISFLYKIQPGPMDRSYGINVAELAGLPAELISRASDILASLEANKDRIEKIPEFKMPEKPKVSPIEEQLKKIDPVNLSPLEALQILFKLCGQAQGKK